MSKDYSRTFCAPEGYGGSSRRGPIAARRGDALFGPGDVDGSRRGVASICGGSSKAMAAARA